MTSGNIIAIVRPVPASIGRCELTHMDRTPIDLELARTQHDDYTNTLARLGCDVVELPSLDEHPDSVFVEDPAIVLDELAIIARSGAESRRGESESVARVLADYRTCHPITAPGCVDGGDALLIGHRLFIGISSRTNEQAMEQIRSIIEPFGYQLIPVRLTDCLHLKTAATAISQDTILCNPLWADPASFDGLRTLEIDPSEPFSGNVVRVQDTLVADSAWNGTNRRLRAAGFEVEDIHLGELTKAEGSVTCSSIVFNRLD